MRCVVTVWKNGTWKVSTWESAWEYRSDPDWLCEMELDELLHEAGLTKE